MVLMNGVSLKDKILDDLRNQVDCLTSKPGLAVIEIGNDEASKVYVKQKEKMALSVGYNFYHIVYDNSVSESDVISKIEELNLDKDIHAIIVQMPIDEKYDSVKIQNTILPEKDVDGLTYYNIGAMVNTKSYCVPCTALGIVELLLDNNISISGKHVVIVGRSNLVGRPLSVLLTNQDATVTLCHSKTKDLSKFTNMADILVVAVGKKYFITSDMVHENAVVVDVGINRVDGKLFGDVDFENVKDKCSYITPVPGGVGPVTIAMLAKGVYNLYMIQKGWSDQRMN